MQIEFPFSDFGEPFEKDYEVSGAKFTVRVLNMGKNDIGPTWLFMILVKGHQIEGGPYNPRFERELSDENVANQLASFWGHTKIIQDAQELAGTTDYELDQLVEKCASFMFRYYNIEGTPFDYDVLAKRMDENGWTIVLMPNVDNKYSPEEPYERGIMFDQRAGEENIRISTYERDRTFYRYHI